MKSLRENPLPWIAGTCAALAGVALVRLIAPACAPQPRLVTTIAGYVLALGGLFVICLGIRRRIPS